MNDSLRRTRSVDHARQKQDSFYLVNDKDNTEVTLVLSRPSIFSRSSWGKRLTKPERLSLQRVTGSYFGGIVEPVIVTDGNSRIEVMNNAAEKLIQVEEGPSQGKPHKARLACVRKNKDGRQAGTLTRRQRFTQP